MDKVGFVLIQNLEGNLEGTGGRICKTHLAGAFRLSYVGAL